MRRHAEKPSKSVNFKNVTIYYFPRAQGFVAVPSESGATLGMTRNHEHTESFSLTKHHSVKDWEATCEENEMYNRLLRERFHRGGVGPTYEWTLSMLKSKKTQKRMPSIFYPLSSRQRMSVLKSAGVESIDSAEKDECNQIRESRVFCGCRCVDDCTSDCLCAEAGVPCQVEKVNAGASYPCPCGDKGCKNKSGRIEYDLIGIKEAVSKSIHSSLSHSSPTKENSSKSLSMISLNETDVHLKSVQEDEVSPNSEIYCNKSILKKTSTFFLPGYLTYECGCSQLDPATESCPNCTCQPMDVCPDKLSDSESEECPGCSQFPCVAISSLTFDLAQLFILNDMSDKSTMTCPCCLNSDLEDNITGLKPPEPTNSNVDFVSKNPGKRRKVCEEDEIVKVPSDLSSENQFQQGFMSYIINSRKKSSVTIRRRSSTKPVASFLPSDSNVPNVDAATVDCTNKPDLILDIETPDAISSSTDVVAEVDESTIKVQSDLKVSENQANISPSDQYTCIKPYESSQNISLPSSNQFLKTAVIPDIVAMPLLSNEKSASSLHVESEPKSLVIEPEPRILESVDIAYSESTIGFVNGLSSTQNDRSDLFVSSSLSHISKDASTGSERVLSDITEQHTVRLLDNNVGDYSALRTRPRTTKRSCADKRTDNFVPAQQLFTKRSCALKQLAQSSSHQQKHDPDCSTSNNTNACLSVSSHPSFQDNSSTTCSKDLDHSAYMNTDHSVSSSDMPQQCLPLLNHISEVVVASQSTSSQHQLGDDPHNISAQKSKLPSSDMPACANLSRFQQSLLSSDQMNFVFSPSSGIWSHFRKNSKLKDLDTSRLVHHFVTDIYSRVPYFRPTFANNNNKDNAQGCDLATNSPSVSC